MNTIDLLDKLNLPTKIGLEGEDALFNKKTIMDAYLSAATSHFNRPLFQSNFAFDMSSTERAYDSLFTPNQVSADLPKQASFDLFKMMGPDGYCDNS